MELTRNGRVLIADENCSMYIFLNGVVMMAANDTDTIHNVKRDIINTLIVLGIPYKTDMNLYESEDGLMHEVTEVTAPLPFA